MNYEIVYSSCHSQIPKRIKQFAEITVASAEFKEKWSKLEISIENIFKEIAIDTTLEILFRIVESFPRDMSSDMFNNLRKLCLNNVSEIAPVLYKDNSSDIVFLEHVATCWKKYRNKLGIIKCIFLTADRRFWSTSPFEDMAIKLWRDMFANNHLINKTMSICLLEIHNERTDVSHNALFSSEVVKMFIDLDLYHSYWEPKYLEEIRLYYSRESKEKLSILSYIKYLSYVNNRLKEEEGRSQVYLIGDDVRLKCRNQLVNIIMSSQLEGLLNSGFKAMMDEKDLCNLELLYNLALLVGSGTASLREHFKSFVMNIGKEIVDNAEGNITKDKRMIQDLLDLKVFLDSVVLQCFKNDSTFLKVIRDCFESFLNERPNKPAEYLAKYLDSKLRSRDGEEKTMEATMDKVMTLFRFITCKDVFEAFYLKDLAKRLLMGKSACVDTEKAMLGRLKYECGPNYTRKMEVMFSDIDNSVRLSKQFAASNNSKASSLRMIVSVICNATWPNLGGSKLLILPQPIVDLQNNFSKFYSANHNGRKLRFEPSLGSCIVRGFFPKGLKDLQVSEHQCMVLLQFNCDSEFLKYRDIETAIGTDADTLKKTLMSLSVGKGQRVLSKKSSGTKVTENDVFFFNEDFEHKLTKIKFNQIQTKETKEEQQATEEQVFSDRQAQLDCNLVKLMKSHRTMEHTALVNAVMKDLRFPLKASNIKKRIEHLIERDYMIRDSVNHSTYHYVA